MFYAPRYPDDVGARAIAITTGVMVLDVLEMSTR